MSKKELIAKLESIAVLQHKAEAIEINTDEGATLHHKEEIEQREKHHAEEARQKEELQWKERRQKIRPRQSSVVLMPLPAAADLSAAVAT